MLPTTGDEIFKKRPAIVLDIAANWKFDLHLVVPLTSWKQSFKANKYFWMIEVRRNNRNKLKNDSAADAFQVKSVSTDRFGKNRIGLVSPSQLDLIVETVAFCIGYSLP